MKILKLTVENIKRIKAIEIKPDGNAVIISGRNGQGKSSTLDAIEMVLSGKDAIPSRPVRDGEKTARIVCETEKYIITRHWTSPETSHLKLELKGEGILGSPQKTLDQLVGDLSFDPLEFSSMEPKVQLKMLKDICKLDFSSLDSEYAKAYEDRKNAGKEGEIHKGTFESFGDIDESIPEMNIEKIKTERDAVIYKNKQIESSERALLDVRNNVKRVKDSIAEVSDKITKLQSELERKNEELQTIEDLIPGLTTAANELPEDTERFDHAIQEWTKYEANQKLIIQKKLTEDKLLASRNSWKKSNDLLKEITETKNKMVEEANMPIDGLSLGDGEVLYHKIPFIQLSTSEQIRVSMAIAMALNPKLKVIIIKNASLLDKAGMDELVKIAEEKSFQVWIEKVAEGPDENCIYIEDGREIPFVTEEEILKSNFDLKESAGVQ